MAAKKTSHSKSTKHHVTDKPPVEHIPDVFDEESVSSSAEIPTPSSVPRGQMVVEVEDTHIESISIPDEVTTPELEENDLPAPTAPSVSEEPVTERKLPAFFAAEKAASAPVNEENVVPVIVNIQSPETQMLEQVVPQAFVGEVREVAREVKQEKKGALVTIFLILGMILVAAGVIGLYVLGTKKTSAPTPTPTPTPVQATPTPTPTVIINTATKSAELSPTTDLKVNVFNGTTIKGLAAKEAAVLKKAGYTIGNVGNGDPTKAGTITVPTGESAVAAGIQSALSNFTFTVKEDAKATSVTVVLPEPNE